MPNITDLKTGDPESPSQALSSLKGFDTQDISLLKPSGNLEPAWLTRFWGKFRDERRSGDRFRLHSF